MLRGDEARRLLIPHFGLPVMVALEPVLASLRAWVAPDGATFAVIRVADEALRSALVRFGFKLRTPNSEYVWWDNRPKVLDVGRITCGTLASRPASAVEGEIYYVLDTSQTSVFARGQWWMMS
jgi:hypothetical protein